MKKIKKLVSLLVILALCAGLCACSKDAEDAKPTEAPATTEAPKATEAPAPTDAPADDKDSKTEPVVTDAPEPTDEPVVTDAPVVEKPETTAVYATATFGQKFSPFFATTAYDVDIVSMTQGGLLAADRGGAIIFNGIEGETINYNGTDYTYYGMGDVEVVENADGTVDYNLKMREDLKFSDGVPATIDDIIFGLYVFSDPTYDGSSTYYALPIEGMQEYYNAMTAASSLMLEAGRDNTDFTNWSEETQTAFWADVDKAGEALAQEIVDYCMANYCDDYAVDYVGAEPDAVRADAGLQVKLGMALWGFGDAWTEGFTAADYWNAIVEAYGGDIATAAATESAGTGLFEFIDGYSDKYGYGISTSDAVDYITGVERTGDYSMTIHCTEFDATTIYNMSFYIPPLHYYGDVNQYDYDNHKFGFTKGDLSSIRSKTSQPLGCGPYVFESYSNGVVTLAANEYYFLGKPEIDHLLFQESVDSDYVPGIATGTFDMATPSISEDTLNAIRDANGGELTGDSITTYLVDYRGYGYIGMNANLVNVGGDPASDASKNLRKAIMTMLAVYRDTAINSYYGDRAAVIQYPISNTSWAAPQPTDNGYQISYSKDVDGNPIYTQGMNEVDKYAAALNAAVGFLKAAGYTFDDATGKFTAAPEGASMSYEVMIPGAGTQDHPAYGVAVAASESLATVGFQLIVNDVGTSTWNNALESNTAELWAAAWQATVDPDMYQVYHSSNANGLNTNSNHYQIQDSALDDLIIAGRKSSDTDFRKATYKEAMEIIMDWGVELPTYQRKDCTTVSTQRIDTNTVPKDMTPYWGVFAEPETLVAIQ